MTDATQNSGVAPNEGQAMSERGQQAIGQSELRQLWLALGCAPNPDDFKPEVRASMWELALDMVRKSTARDNRVYRENLGLEAEIALLRRKNPEPVITDEMVNLAADGIERYDDEQPSGPFNIREDNEGKARAALEAALVVFRR